MSILLVVLLVLTVLYVLGGHRVAGGRYAATNPVLTVELRIGVFALALVLAAIVVAD